MRDIKFRAVSKLNGNWVYGSYVKHLETIQDEFQDFDIYIETLCQYTGIKDKNGTKIFEGDIVYDSYREYSYLVKYWLGQGMYILDKINDRDGNWYSFEDVDFSENIEVIGNIYDNPELLEDL